MTSKKKKSILKESQGGCSSAVITSSHTFSRWISHSYDVQYKQPCANTQIQQMKICLLSIFVFNKFDSLWTLSKISEVYEWDIKPLQKVFTLHYWRFFWFKYLFSLFCITLICLWFRLLGNRTSRRTQAMRAEGKTERSSRTLQHARYVLVVVFVCELACAYSTRAFCWSRSLQGWSMIELQLPLSPRHFSKKTTKQGEHLDFQH